MTTYAIDRDMYPRLIAAAVRMRDRADLRWYRVEAEDQIAAAQRRKDAAGEAYWRDVALQAARGMAALVPQEVVLVDEGEVMA